MRYFRVRTGRKDKEVVIATDLPTIELAYQAVIDHGKGTSNKYYIDEISSKLVASVRVGEARKRVERIAYDNNNAESHTEMS